MPSALLCELISHPQIVSQSWKVLYGRNGDYFFLSQLVTSYKAWSYSVNVICRWKVLTHLINIGLVCFHFNHVLFYDSNMISSNKFCKFYNVFIFVCKSLFCFMNKHIFYYPAEFRNDARITWRFLYFTTARLTFSSKCTYITIHDKMILR